MPVSTVVSSEAAFARLQTRAAAPTASADRTDSGATIAATLAPASAPAGESDDPSKALWARAARSASPIVRGLMLTTSLLSLAQGKARVACPARVIVKARQHASSIAGALSKELGQVVELELVTIDEPDAGVAPDDSQAVAGSPATEIADARNASAPPISTPASTPAPAPARAFNPTLSVEHPLVKQAVELFGARIVDVQPRRT